MLLVNECLGKYLKSTPAFQADPANFAKYTGYAACPSRATGWFFYEKATYLARTRRQYHWIAGAVLRRLWRLRRSTVPALNETGAEYRLNKLCSIKIITAPHNSQEGYIWCFWRFPIKLLNIENDNYWQRVIVQRRNPRKMRQVNYSGWHWCPNHAVL